MEFVPGFNVWARRLITLLFPSSCLTCENDVQPNEGPICSECLRCVSKRVQSTSTTELDQCLSLAPLKGKLKDLIHLYKYAGRDYLAPVLADILIQQWPQPPMPCDAMVAVPMSPWKKIVRGYNQSALLTDYLSKRWTYTIIKSGIRRKWSRAQVALSRQDRLKNAQNSFYTVKTDCFVGQRILLVDDVVTTGATLDTCARLLKSRGAKWVGAVTLAYD